MASYSFSRLSQTLRRSVMRDLIALASAPDIISFAGGLPAADHLPTAHVQVCVEAVLARDGARALQYGPPFMPLREWLADYMSRRGVNCAADHIFITSGAQQALELVARLFLEAGAPVALEALTFTGIAQAMSAHSAEIKTVPVSLTEGVDVDALAATFAQTPRPRLAVVIPSFHNPLGVTVPAARRPCLAELAARYGVPLIEDDPYSPLRYEGESLPPIKAYDEAGMVLYIGSFSKMLAPAMRLGWIVAPPEMVARLTVLREAIDLESSQLLQRTAHEFLMRGFLEPHLAALNAANRERRDAIFAALECELGNLAQWTEPQGGLFVWVTLPQGMDTDAIFPRALENKVAYIPGAHFAPAGSGPANALRLNYSNATPERIREGVRRLAKSIE